MYTIDYGIHRNTYTSRDTGQPREFDTEQEAMKWFREEKIWLRSTGYTFWFCTLTKPDGSKISLAGNANY